ncbi:MAG: iron-containing alcohol dehydrogenase, partial [Firmicutes bacterium]|nr:iron-containing alcohol dehydrogenase [Bacillota bacterium]
EETALKGIAALRAFYKSIGMPTTLAELGVPADELKLLASKVKRAPDGTTGQFVKLTEEDCLKIYELMK